MVVEVDAPDTLVDEVDVDPTPVDEVVLPTVVVVVDDEEVVVVVDGEVVVVVVGVGRVVVGGLSKIFSTVVPPPELPKRSANGCPAMTSTIVTKIRVSTNTPMIMPAISGHDSLGGRSEWGDKGAISLFSDSTDPGA